MAHHIAFAYRRPQPTELQRCVRLAVDILVSTAIVAAAMGIVLGVMVVSTLVEGSGTLADLHAYLSWGL